MLAERNPTTSSVMLKQFFSTTRSDFPQGSYDTGINGLISGTIAVNGADLTIDQFAEVHRIFTPEDVSLYATLIGDDNPIHRSSLKNETLHSNASQQIVHGMLVSSLFSSIFGTLIPGSVYRSQSVSFQTPIYSNESVIGRVQVKTMKSLKSRGMLVTCLTNVYKNNGEEAVDIANREHTSSCVTGEAVVWLP